MLKTVFIITFSFVYLAVCQVTPEDEDKMKGKLNELDVKLENTQRQINNNTNTLIISTIEKVRETGDFKAFLCASNEAEVFLKKVYSEGNNNLSYLADKLGEIVKKLDFGTLTAEELEDIKQGVESGDYDAMVDQIIELTEKYDGQKQDEFLNAVELC